MQINIPLDAKALDGNKTYLLLLTGAATIVANHFGLLPPDVPTGLDPNNWLLQLFVLATGATGRSALKKLESDTLTPQQAARADQIEAMFAPLLNKLIQAQLIDHGIVTPAVDRQATAG